MYIKGRQIILQSPRVLEEYNSTYFYILFQTHETLENI